MQETPRFLVASKQYNVARRLFAQMAEFNGVSNVDPYLFKFEQEVTKVIVVD
jgi:hypothetical protein